MGRNTPTRPPRRADGRADSSENCSTVSDGSGAGEEKCTTVAIRLRPLNEREKAAKQNRIWRCVPTHNSVTQVSQVCCAVGYLLAPASELHVCFLQKPYPRLLLMFFAPTVDTCCCTGKSA